MCVCFPLLLADQLIFIDLDFKEYSSRFWAWEMQTAKSSTQTHQIVLLCTCLRYFFGGTRFPKSEVEGRGRMGFGSGGEEIAALAGFLQE